MIGQAAVILAALFYAGSAVFARKATQHVAGLARGAAPLITATLFMWLLGPITEKPFLIPNSASDMDRRLVAGYPWLGPRHDHVLLPDP